MWTCAASSLQLAAACTASISPTSLFLCLLYVMYTLSDAADYLVQAACAADPFQVCKGIPGRIEATCIHNKHVRSQCKYNVKR